VKSLAFLQCLAKVSELAGPGTGGAHLGGKVPSDGIHRGMTRVTFRAHLPERTRKGRQSFLPSDDGALLAVKVPLLSKELLL
jgi:hypothetical protein